MSFWDDISERLAALSGSATPLEARNALNEFNARDIEAVRVSEGGGGSSSPAFVGAAIALSTNGVTVSTGAVVPVNSVTADSHGFYNAGGTKLVIPADLAGVYLVGMIADITLDHTTQSGFLGVLRTSGDPNNVDSPFSTTDISGDSGVINGSAIMAPLAVGDDLRATVTFNGGGTVGIGRTSTLLWCQYLGPAV